MKRGLLINATHGNVLRLLPALTLTDAELAAGCDVPGICMPAAGRYDDPIGLWW